MNNIQEYFGVKISPDSQCPPLNLQHIEEEITRLVSQMANFNPKEYKVYLYTIAFYFPANTSDKLDSLECRLRLPKSLYKEGKIRFLNQYVPLQEPYYYLDLYSNNLESNSSYIRVEPHQNRIFYAFDENIINKISRFYHRLILFVNKKVEAEDRKLRAVLTGIANEKYKKELISSKSVSQSIKDALEQRGGIKSNFKVRLVDDHQYNIFESIEADDFTKTFDAAISYNSKASEQVIIFYEKLLDKGVFSWFDKKDLSPGELVIDRLGEVFSSVPYVIICIDESGLGPWQNAEVRTALKMAISNETKVIPVLFPGEYESPNLPAFLSQYAWLDFRKGFRQEGINQLASTILSNNQK